MAGYNIPQGIADLLAKRKIELPDKEEIIVIEVFIPLNKEVFVFGTFDGDRSIVFETTRMCSYWCRTWIRKHSRGTDACGTQ